MSSSPERQDGIELRLINRPDEARRLHDTLTHFLGPHEISARAKLAIDLSLEELFANILHYGYRDTLEHAIFVRCRLEGAELHLEIEDDGVPFDLTSAPEPDLSLPLDERPVGGLGIHLVRKSMDSVRYERREGRNILRCVKRVR